MVAAESVSCVELFDRGVDYATVVAAARAYAEPVPPSVGMAKPKAKTLSAAGEIDTRPVQPSAEATKQKHEPRIFPGGQKGRQSLRVAR